MEEGDSRGARLIAVGASGGPVAAGLSNWQQSDMGYFAFLLSAGSLTEASNPVFETDSAIFFGSVLVGS